MEAVRCEHFTVLIPDVLKGNASESEAISLEDHLRICHLCQIEYNRTRWYFTKLNDSPMTIPAPFHLLEELTDIVWQRTSPAFDAHSVQPSSSKRTKETQYERGKEKPAAKQKWKVFLQTAGLILLLTAAFVIWRHFK